MLNKYYFLWIFLCLTSLISHYFFKEILELDKFNKIKWDFLKKKTKLKSESVFMINIYSL